LPGDVRASLKVHNGSGGPFIGLNELWNAEWIDRVCTEMVEIHSGFELQPLDTDSVPSYSWHPGWIAVGGWDVYQILVHVETGAVYYFDEANAEWQTISWAHWLENVATRLEFGEFVLDESGNWVDSPPGPVPYMRKYYTPGSEHEAQWQ
jgi:cell wall assembly regulator SMI1